MKKFRDVKIFIKAHLWLIPLLALLVGLFIWALDPAPPTHLSMATGNQTGGYHDFGKRLQARLAEEGIRLDLVNTEGSLDNLQRLLAKGSPVQIGLVQSGTELLLEKAQRRQLLGLGAMYQEPLWLFQQRDLQLDRLSDLADKRIGTGSDGSGTQAVVNSILDANQLTRGAGWQSIGGRRAADALLNGELDAAFFIGPAENDLIRELAASDRLRLTDMRRAPAYEARFRFLKALVIPEGLLDLAHNSPDRQVTTVSPMATLVANQSLHPALTPVLLEAARDISRKGTLIDPPNSFPRAEPITFELSKEADNYYRHGTPYLQRYLPFGIASVVDRYIVLLIPFLAILFPLFKSISPLYQWRIRSRIYRWYRHLHDIDDKIHNGIIHDQLDEEIRKLDALEDELSQVEVPLSYSHELYELHLHVRYEVNRLRGIKEGNEESTAAPGLPELGGKRKRLD